MDSLRGGPPAPPGRASARNHPTDPQGRPLAASPRCHGWPGKKAASEGRRDGAGPARAAARSGSEAATVAIGEEEAPGRASGRATRVRAAVLCSPR